MSIRKRFSVTYLFEAKASQSDLLSLTQCIGIFCSDLSSINLFNNAAIYDAESIPSYIANASAAKELRTILLILLDC